MDGVEIHLLDHREHYTAGDFVYGTATVTLSNDLQMQDVVVSFHGHGKSQWVENPNTPYYCDGKVYADQIECHEEVAIISDKGIFVVIYLFFSNLNLKKKCNAEKPTFKNFTAIHRYCTISQIVRSMFLLQNWHNSERQFCFCN